MANDNEGNDREKRAEVDRAPSVEAESPEQQLVRLEAEVAQLAAENLHVADRVRDGYVRLLQLLDPKDPLKMRAIEAKRAFDARLKELRPPESVAVVEKPIEVDSRLHDEAVFPKADADLFQKFFEQLPEPLKRKYSERLQTVLKSKDEASTITALRGATFEMSRIVTLIKQGLEQIDLRESGRKLTVTYLGYEKVKGGSPDYSIAPTKEYKDAELQLDVPMTRDGKPYVYETKSYPRMRYGAGTEPAARNQLLKYQTAIEKGVIEGATLEIRGRLDKAFLNWAMGEKVDDPGHVPAVEIIYTFDLPSGKEYRFVLKRAQGRDGLEFRNEDKYDAEDQEVIRGIQQSLADKSIVRIMTEVNIDSERASPELRPLLADPMKITTKSLFEEYDRLRNQAITEILHGKIESAKVNTENKKGATSEYANPEYVERLIREYQDFLRQNPEIAKAKGAYILTEDRIRTAVTRTMDAIRKIADYEHGRSDATSSGFAAEAKRIRERRKFGYNGRPEGVALDIDHVMIDTIYSLNKEGLDRATIEKTVGKPSVGLFTVAGTTEGTLVLKYRSVQELEQALQDQDNTELRVAYDKMSRSQRDNLGKLFKEAEFVRSYDWPERFSAVEHLPEYLKEQDRRYMEIQIIDPKDGKVTRQADTNEDDIERTKNNLIRENITRARDYIQGTKRESQNKHAIARIEDEIGRLENERDQAIEPIEQAAKQAAGRLSQEIGALKKKRSERFKGGANADELAGIDAQMVDLDTQRKGAFAEIRRVSEDYQSRVMAQYEQLTELYHQIVPDAEWEKFAKRVTKTIDQNIIKFIYVATAEGEVAVQEEVVRGDVSGRAAHSELARGRNVYGAGELAFTKIDEKWKLTEINNGSGHYRPDALSTLPYVKNLIANQGVDVGKAELVDSILRGRPLREASAF